MDQTIHTEAPPTTEGEHFQRWLDDLFRLATDLLFRPITREELAVKIGCSVAAIGRARLERSAPRYRALPPRWTEAVIATAEDQIKFLQETADDLRRKLADRPNDDDSGGLSRP